MHKAEHPQLYISPAVAAYRSAAALDYIYQYQTARRMIKVALFKKKDKQNEETTENKELDLKGMALEALNQKLNGHLYDGCIIMPRGGYTIDINVARQEEKEGIKLAQFVYIIRHDDFDEPIIEPTDSQGKTWEEAADVAARMFMGSIWHCIDQASQRKNPILVPVDYLGQHYDFDMFSQSVVRVGVSEDVQPTMLVNFIKDQIPKYLGSKKYYWLRIFLARFGNNRVVEVRVNGSVCVDLAPYFQQYVDQMDAGDKFVSEKQYAFFVQHEDDKCPFNKETVVNAAKDAIDRMTKIKSREDYEAMAQSLVDMTGSKSLAAEIRIFIPEILAKMTLGFREGDKLFLIADDSQIEFRKTQLRSYFYIQQVVLEFLSRRPATEEVQSIVYNSVAFKEMRKVLEDAKKNGQEIQPGDLFVPGTAYKVGEDDYFVW